MEIKRTNRKRRTGVKRNKKASSSVDLTPMVDLGFLLITFFIFSITMSQPKSMKLIVPKDSKEPVNVKNSGALTLLPGKNNLVWYYFGMKPSKLEYTTYKDVGKIILEKKKSTLPEDLFIIIKPGEDATYKNTVDILDEMNINDIPRYAMIDQTPEEIMLMKKME